MTAQSMRDQWDYKLRIHPLPSQLSNPPPDERNHIMDHITDQYNKYNSYCSNHSFQTSFSIFSIILIIIEIKNRLITNIEKNEIQ